MKTTQCDFCSNQIIATESGRDGDSKLIFSEHVRNASLIELDLCFNCTQTVKEFLESHIRKA